MSAFLDFDSLNPEQREAALHPGGPLLIFAGAGSGKTRVITYRIARLLHEGVSASRILAVTFTNKAAREMRERVEGLVGDGAKAMWIGTFHSLCARILRIDGKHIGLDSNFVIYDDGDQLSLIREVFKAKNIDDKSIQPRGVLNEISSAKEKLKSPEEYAKGATGFFERIAADVYKSYNALLHKANALDFDDILYYTNRLFDQRPDVLEKYQDRFMHVLVDEYQDVNFSQYKIVHALAGKHRNVVVVGDDDQCLVAGTMVKTVDGDRRIEDVATSSCVVAAAGHGKLTNAPVERAESRRFVGPVVRIVTESGRTLVATFNHLLFARLEPKEDLHHVYLMYRKDLGYRIGKTKGVRGRKADANPTSGLMVRANGEVADKLYILRSCNSAEEAAYYEALYAFQYGIPTTVFHVRGRRMALTQPSIRDLFGTIDTRERAAQLLSDLGMCEEYPHHRPSAVVRGDSERRIVNLTFFGGPRVQSARSWHEHRISLISSGEAFRARVEEIWPTRVGKGTGWRVETSRKEYDEAAAFARRLMAAEDVELSVRAKLSADKPFNVMPARHVQPGMVIPVEVNGHVVEERVQEVREEAYDGLVYDLSVANLRNFVANGIVVHNSIYAWRGADVSLILKFSSDYPDAKIVKLERNYRSTKTILAAANEVIKRNRGRARKELWTENHEGVPITLTQAGTEQDEGMMVADAILKDVRVGRRKFSDFAVLYRTNAQSRVMEEAFLTLRIPHILVGGQRFYERKEIKDMLSYLRLAFNPRDDVSFRRAINTPTRGIGPTAMSKFEDWAAERGLPLSEAARDQELQSVLPKKTAGAVRGFVSVIGDAQGLSEQGPVTPVLRSLLSGSGYVDALKAEHSQEALGRLENLQELLNVTAEYDASSDEPSLAGFLESVSLVADVDALGTAGGDAVTLMTLHSAKGLEFPVVFMTGLEEGVFPHSRSLNSDSELEEERRLAYVGMTRAREELHILHAHRRSMYGTPNFNRRSRFLDDIPNHLLDTLNPGGYQPQVRQPVAHGSSGAYRPIESVTPPAPKKPDNWKPPFSMGQSVRHPKFGIGVVVACNPIKDDVEVTVAFPGVVGVKKLVQKLAKLEAVT